MLCQNCHVFSKGLICEACRRKMRPAPDRLLPGGIRVVAAFEHSGPARVLVHHLKYRGLTEYADLVADLLAPRLPPLPLVPVPRALSRRLRYGVDPARVIAERLAQRLKAPFLPLMDPPIHTRRRAGGDHREPVIRFAARACASGQVLLVDDVVTTGATLLGAAAAIGRGNVGTAVAANTVPEVSSLRAWTPS